MAHFKRTVPEAGYVWVVTDIEAGSHQLWCVSARLVGTAQFVSNRKWLVAGISGDLQFPTAAAAETYLRDVEARQVRSLEAGVYAADVESVQQAAGRITIRLRSGEEIEIQTASR